MNEAETRAEHIDPALKAAGWGVVEGSRILREYHITPGRLEGQRILLTLATGTGKTLIAFQIAWKLFHSRWNLSREPVRRPRILFLADRNILGKLDGLPITSAGKWTLQDWRASFPALW